MLVRRKSLIVMAILTVLLVVGGLAFQSAEDGSVVVVTTFNPAFGEFPEGVAVDKTGNMFVSVGAPLGPVGEVRMIAPDGSQSTLYQLPNGPGPAGLAVDAQGRVYYGLFTLDENTRGVYRVDSDGVPYKLPGSGNIILPNGLAFDQEGNLYVTDSIPGIVWRFPRRGPAELWFQDGSLLGCGFDPNLPPVGANGIAFWRNGLYVASTEQGALMYVPILPDGSAGEPELVAGKLGCDPGLDGLSSLDGIALDVHGDVFGALVIQNKLVKIDPVSGDFDVLLDETDGLHNPASLAFGTGRSNRETIYITNFALIPPGPPAGLGPAVLAYDAGVPGMPLP